jgi:hypothetical protein
VHLQLHPYTLAHAACRAAGAICELLTPVPPPAKASTHNAERLGAQFEIVILVVESRVAPLYSDEIVAAPYNANGYSIYNARAAYASLVVRVAHGVMMITLATARGAASRCLYTRPYWLRAYGSQKDGSLGGTS